MVPVIRLRQAIVNEESIYATILFGLYDSFFRRHRYGQWEMDDIGLRWCTDASIYSKESVFSSDDDDNDDTNEDDRLNDPYRKSGLCSTWVIR